jgi:BMFP domain-containing protein YqiC
MTDELDLVEGDELARVEKMAQKARQRQTELEERVSDLESRLNELEGN